MNQERLLSRVGLFRVHDQKPPSNEKLLAQVSIFRRLDPQQLAELAKYAEMRTYEPGQVVAAENDVAEALHVVVSGTLNVSKASPGREPVVSSSLESGQYCCEMALLEDVPRPASIVAANPTTCLTLRKTRFQEALAAHPSIAVAVVFAVSGRLRDTLDLLDANA